MIKFVLFLASRIMVSLHAFHLYILRVLQRFTVFKKSQCKFFLVIFSRTLQQVLEIFESDTMDIRWNQNDHFIRSRAGV